MKPLRILALLFLLLAGASQAQAQFGIKAGINNAVLDGQNINMDTDYKTTYHVGAFLRLPILGPLSIQPEVLYSLQGSQFKSTVSNYDTKLHYLNIPVLAHVKVGPVYAEAGPQFGVLLGARENGTLRISAADGYGPVDRTADSNYKKNDFALAAGAGLELGSLIIGARYTAGLNNINDVADLNGANDPRLKNRVIQAFVGIKFGK
ncbi:porin family protein [Hymenobacter sp. YC55]|uniref:porin family protein n=1 Tax=Hymenobacter sp. YC55 TaxID=3034019 RepID=UPI0023F98C51|nr:porin family protein [Hymenobacter sp. YC55]MDF7814410.1 porin family protein [Hymenobacter sp. YC55]